VRGVEVEVEEVEVEVGVGVEAELYAMWCVVCGAVYGVVWRPRARVRCQLAAPFISGLRYFPPIIFAPASAMDERRSLLVAVLRW
jgi:predicted membrane protein